MNGEHPNTREAPSTDPVSHTPGPWGLLNDEDDERYEIGVNAEFAGIKVIASLDYGFYEPFDSQQHANARLIAAAPDMLDGLRRAVDTFRDIRMICELVGRLMTAEACRVAEEATRKVIDKAEGRS